MIIPMHTLINEGYVCILLFLQLDPIPEEQEEEQGREANNPPVEDVSSSGIGIPHHSNQLLFHFNY